MSPGRLSRLLRSVVYAKTPFTLALLLIISAAAFCAPVTQQEAVDAVRSWLAADPAPLNAQLGRQIMDAAAFRDSSGEVDYYVIYLAPKGFVIVSADDLVEPIVAFVVGDTYDPSPDNPLGTLVSTDLHGRMSEARGLVQAALKSGRTFAAQGQFKNAQNKWKQLIAGSMQIQNTGQTGVSDLRVAPFVQSKWSQGSECSQAVYNYYVPPGPDGNANNYPCGCVATAMAQLMRYYQYPTAAIGVHSFTITVDKVGQTRNTRGGDGAGGPYGWANMPLDPGCGMTLAQRQAIGALSYDCGVSVGMGYAASGSGADTFGPATQLVSTFGYSHAVKGWSGSTGTSLNGSALSAMLNPNLDARFPCILGIFGSGGHEIITDGYGYNATTMYHHLNLGWGGYEDAWYNLPNIGAGGYTFNSVAAALYNIFVTGTGEIISGRVTDPLGHPIAGASVKATQTSKPGQGAIYGPVTTDSNGIYAIVKIPSSTTYTLSVQYSSYAFAAQSVTTGNSSDYSTTVGNKWGINFQGAGGPSITSMKINSDAATTSVRSVTLNNTCSGGPAYYMASEKTDFIGASWLAYSTAPTFLMSAGGGLKTVYFKIKDAAGIESSVVSDTIQGDETLPSSTASPTTSVHREAFTVTLTSSKPGSIYYTTSGAEPTALSIRYFAPLQISRDMTLRFFAVDQMGNQENPKQQANYYFVISDGSIADAKKVADGQEVRLGGKILYYTSAGSGYIEEPNRAAGVRVQGAITKAPDYSVLLVGNMTLPVGGEPYIQVSAMTPEGSALAKPVAMNNRGLLNNLLDGIYVTTWGVVQPGSIMGDSYRISDGSDTVGIKIITAGAPSVTAGSFVTVTGAASFDGGRVIYAR